MLVGQGVKVSDSGVISGDKGVLVAMGGFVGVKVAITEVAWPAGMVSTALVGVAVGFEDGVGVVSRSAKNQ